jgi:hypothetical protein
MSQPQVLDRLPATDRGLGWVGLVNRLRAQQLLVTMWIVSRYDSMSAGPRQLGINPLLQQDLIEQNQTYYFIHLTR